MGNSLRCCLACVLPCGALDVIRVVHLSGHVDEYSRPIAAAEVLAANPNHVLSKPCSQVGGGGARWILIVSPESELRRGDIYFLIPAASTSVSSIAERKKKCAQKINQQQQQQQQQQSKKSASMSDDESHNRYLAEVMSEKHSGGPRRRRSGARVAVWRPHLESICEDV
ncbi:uncharacterized protein LOC109703988 [Ananas comosus]|uniref:Uncharacterized protein LOC109703988 n=1 Tax=Ananas comosus TaxID=4615 RepID=A0A6P5EFP2_ANACO|nr:uncharacterized protein LOC109703988 [Ananas comosus]